MSDTETHSAHFAIGQAGPDSISALAWLPRPTATQNDGLAHDTSTKDECSPTLGLGVAFQSVPFPSSTRVRLESIPLCVMVWRPTATQSVPVTQLRLHTSSVLLPARGPTSDHSVPS